MEEDHPEYACMTVKSEDIIIPISNWGRRGMLSLFRQTHLREGQI